MWVARNKNNILRVFLNKPMRFQDGWNSVDLEDITRHSSIEINVIPIDESLFPELKWEDEPLEVELIAQSQFERFIDDIIHMYISSCNDCEFHCDAERIRYIQDKMTGKYVGSKK